MPCLFVLVFLAFCSPCRSPSLAGAFLVLCRGSWSHVEWELCSEMTPVVPHAMSLVFVVLLLAPVAAGAFRF